MRILNSCVVQQDSILQTGCVLAPVLPLSMLHRSYSTRH